jgi:hypothetical protein
MPTHDHIQRWQIIILQSPLPVRERLDPSFKVLLRARAKDAPPRIPIQDVPRSLRRLPHQRLKRIKSRQQLQMRPHLGHAHERGNIVRPDPERLRKEGRGVDLRRGDGVCGRIGGCSSEVFGVWWGSVFAHCNGGERVANGGCLW